MSSDDEASEGTTVADVAYTARLQGIAIGLTIGTAIGIDSVDTTVAVARDGDLPAFVPIEPGVLFLIAIFAIAAAYFSRQVDLVFRKLGGDDE